MTTFDFKAQSAALTGFKDLRTKVEDVKGVAGKIGDAKNSALGFMKDPLNALTGGFGGGLANLGAGSSDTAEPSTAQSSDFRVRLRAMQPKQVYGPDDKINNILSILYETNGLLFPYTPSIEWSQQVEYSSTSLTHTNQDYQIYKNTPSTSFRVTGDFTVQNYREAKYMLAVIHFLRTVSKMRYGATDDMAGMPPPVLLFSGYGDYMFNDLPVIIKDHSFSLAKEMDYVDIETPDGTKVRLPALLTISMSLVVQNTPKKHKDEFNLDKFRTGELMKKKGWI